jgi:hypothetical protein
MAASINASTSGGVVTTADTTGNLNLQSNGTTVLAMTSAGVAVTGTLIPSGKITATTAGIDVPTSALGTCYSGTYTPTLTNGVNVAASTAFACQYMRVGNVVTVSGQVNIDPTLATTYTQLEMTIPVASNFTSGRECGGTGVTIPGSGLNATAAMYANTTTKAVTLGASFPDPANQAIYFVFVYQVV